MLSSSTGKRRAKHPFEDNPFIDGFLEWMDAPEGQQSIEALDLVFGALEHAGVDARQRKIVWADGKRLSIEQSTDRIHAGHPGAPCHLIETRRVLGWLENCALHPIPNTNWRNPTVSSGPGSATMSARHEPQENSRELGTLEEDLICFIIISGLSRKRMVNQGDPRVVCFQTGLLQRVVAGGRTPWCMNKPEVILGAEKNDSSRHGRRRPATTDGAVDGSIFSTAGIIGGP